MSRPAPAVTVLGVNYPPEPTGISPYTGAMSRGLTRLGYRTHVVTTHPHYPEWRVSPGYGQWSRKELLDGISAHRVRHYVPRKPSGIRRLLSELSFGARLLFAPFKTPDAVVAVSPALFSSAAAALRMKLLHRGTPLVVWVQDLYWLGLRETGQDGGLSSRVIRATEKWLLSEADGVVVIHDRFADRVSADFDIPRERIHVVRNWTHLAPSAPVDRAAARAALGWGDEIVVLHAGNMGIKQGLGNVVDAAELADERGDQVRFVLMGGGGERDRLKQLGEGVASLQFIDPLPDAEFSAALAAADILLVNEYPGVSEMAVPSKLTSYFSSGRPVLAATDVKGITADEIRAAGAGVVVPAANPRMLLDAALDLGRDHDRATALGANGKRYRETVLDETFAIESFATLLGTLIDGDRARPPRTVASAS
ncbi:glycosyltransferase family 4 protein [Microbacterium sp. EYE_5]|uniref:glycosyltransferase family 4 protein n=1 Tax=unclassified Microbacterium TaxID=2609290 RepID=UPI00249D9ABD|nr:MULTISPECIES: glycosyltransferase family 4 protein [unclassified Microbacterium]MCK6079049.1 glycosyltransferase family 4 protein [Microbacterium sp. EYE_382]MCK6084319.1 glycosyltransferase family 4 protein [Microbacterium sp. EYE_384]MCK6123452.1 glycosyltransferase family 4 protein [Microbacterium sp. EYE_80]MCK6125083.1 glycosyltransferase family 4 protein [Microbacterium sp. EYE_79]MCK6140003.1 glycosyltransferase family 4 protein [Microbacterium sp. EYE_39]